MEDTLIRRAMQYAITAHGDQKYGEEFPYSLHLQMVDSVLVRFGVVHPSYRCVAWLHDVLEDTDRQYEEVEALFGPEIAQAVAALTEPKGGNRKWRHSQTYPRIKANYVALTVKLADRIANIECGGRKNDMYRKEHVEFKRALYGQSPFTVVGELWDHLDNLVSKIPVSKKVQLDEQRADELSALIEKAGQ